MSSSSGGSVIDSEVIMRGGATEDKNAGIGYGAAALVPRPSVREVPDHEETVKKLFSRCVIAFAAIAVVQNAHAQRKVPETTFGISGGFAMRTGTAVSQVIWLGPVVSGQATRRFGSRLGARAQMLLARFAHHTPQGDLSPCFFDPTVQCTPDLKGPLTLGGATGSIIINDDQTISTGSGAHYILGGSLYKPLRSPDGVYSLGTGWSVGLGFDLGSTEKPHGTIELKYERIRQSRDRQWTIIPVTLGIVW